jgi:hypothetical protein
MVRCSPTIIVQEAPSPLVLVDCGWETSPSPAPPSFTIIQKVFLGPGGWSTYQPFRLIGGITSPITSVDASMPVCDGVLLESGSAGQSVNAAMLAANVYGASLSLPGTNGDLLWLPKTAAPMTAIKPTLAAGNIWSLPIGRKNSLQTFVLSPSLPIKL